MRRLVKRLVEASVVSSKNSAELPVERSNFELGPGSCSSLPDDRELSIESQGQDTSMEEEILEQLHADRYRRSHLRRGYISGTATAVCLPSLGCWKGYGYRGPGAQVVSPRYYPVTSAVSVR